MPTKADRKEESRARILASAGRGFRSRGYGGLGVDGLAKEAGVTSGAFYAHFTSKAAAFREAVAAGMQDLRLAIEQLRSAEGGPAWRQRCDRRLYTARKRRHETGGGPCRKPGHEPAGR